MALANADRVKETTTTTGTGSYSLGGAETGFQSFSAGVGADNTCWYCATDDTDWEVGLGTVNGTATQLARTTIYASSNAGAAVNWGAGTKDLFVTLPASKAVDPGGAQTISGAWEFSDQSRPMPIGNATGYGVKIGKIDSADITTGEANALVGHAYDVTLGYGNLYLRPRNNSSGLAVKIVSGLSGAVNEIASFSHGLIEHQMLTRHNANLELRSQNRLFFYNAANTSNATIRLATFFDFDGNGASVQFSDINTVVYRISGNFQMQDSDNGNANVFIIGPTLFQAFCTNYELTLPTSNPGGTNRLWNDGGTVKIT